MTPAELDALEEKLGTEIFENRGATGRLVGKAAAAIRQLREENRRYKAALTRIAKPALGGKGQQRIAQEALSAEEAPRD